MVSVGIAEKIAKEEKREVLLHASLTTCFYAKLKPCFVIGIVRMRSPVAVKIALQTAGRIGGNAGSPKPVGELLDLIQCTSIGGVCDIFTSGCW